MKEMIRMGVILMVICAVAAAALAYTNQVTSGIIEERLAREKIALLRELFPAVETSEDKTVDGRTATIGYDANGNVVGILADGKTAGYGGDIRFNLAIDGEGKIVRLTILAHAETPGLGSKIADEEYRNKYVGKTVTDSFDVDDISGATISCKAIENGVERAMKEIMLRFGDSSSVPSAPTLNLSEVKDGVYEGDGEGRNGAIKVSVTVAGGKITRIEVLSHSETASYFTKAQAVLDTIIAKQAVQVDAASGATISSNGIMDAVFNALAQ